MLLRGKLMSNTQAVKLFVAQNALYDEVQKAQLNKENFENSQNIFNIFDENKDNILSDDEINNCLKTIDCSDGEYNSCLTQDSLNKYAQNSCFGTEYSKELADFTNQIFDLTQENKTHAEIYSAIAEQEEFNYNVPNGKIDYFEQGDEYGDCWLLAQMHAMSNTSWGSELIYNSIKENSNGDYLISFDGVNTDIPITKKELEEAQNSGKYATGDSDVILLEMAVEKYLNSYLDDQEVLNEKRILSAKYAKNGNAFSLLSYNKLGTKTSLQYLLTQNTGTIINKNQNNSKKLMDEALKAKMQDNSSCALACVFEITKNTKEYASRGIENEHMYSIVTIAENYNCEPIVVLRNPYNADAYMTLYYSEFLEMVYDLAVIKNPNE